MIRYRFIFIFLHFHGVLLNGNWHISCGYNSPSIYDCSHL